MARRNAVLSSGLAHSVPAPARLACPAEEGARAIRDLLLPPP